MAGSTSEGRGEARITEIAPGVHFVEGPASNWTILSDGSTVTLVDAGYPADLHTLEATIAEVAPDAALTDVLVTHGHSDHIGGIPALVAAHGVRVWASAAEAPNVRREELHQIGIADVLPRLIWPRYMRWVTHALKAGGLRDIHIDEVELVKSDTPMVFSGQTVIPRLTAGHTPGHLVYELPDANAIITGDAVVTAHPTSTKTGLQGLSSIWHWDAPQAAEVTRTLIAAHSPDVALLPGHGPALLPPSGQRRS